MGSYMGCRPKGLTMELTVREILWKSQPIYVFKVTGLSDKSVQTMRSHLEWSDLVMYSGVELGLESHARLGRMREWTLTLKIQEPNSGAATVGKRMLLLMNFVEVSISHICSDGSTVIQSLWKSKEEAAASMLPIIGSRQTSTQETGTPKQRKNRRKRSCDV